ncbi:uncharacterized protein LOC122291091 [Carya illinoinensis]|uniref:uncharacterized protein LOC122291091 n=1 Tax=Carya illinoinensis TaxID=32201 RepID=UPI001C72882A|nr:uncharacterized protein LOC122291091 [Carya illinoinensis]
MVSFFGKDPDEAFEDFNFLAENAQSWDVYDVGDRFENVRGTFGSGKYQLKEVDDLHARIAQVSKKLESIKLKKVNQMHVLPPNADKCGICEDQGHSTHACPTIPAFKEILLDQPNAVNRIAKNYSGPFPNTYNAGWKKHPNLSWKIDQQASSSTAPNMPYFMQSQATINNQNSQAINDIRGTLTKVTTTLSAQEKGKVPIQPQPNPQIQQPQVEGLNVKAMKAITTLRSGRIVHKPEHIIGNSGKESDSKQDGELHVENFESSETIPAPFPQRLISVHKEKQNSEILEIFKQVRINIPLLDAIKQIPAYAKFLKDLIGQALLDLGSGVNLLPYSVYEQLGLGELKPTSIILQLADRSIKMPRGVVEDVLVQVDRFYYPVDFVVLDMKLTTSTNVSSAPVILGRPFLATSNAIMNCRSGVLKLSFGNMTLELNIFNLCRQPQEPEEV